MWCVSHHVALRSIWSLGAYPACIFNWCKCRRSLSPLWIHESNFHKCQTIFVRHKHSQCSLLHLWFAQVSSFDSCLLVSKLIVDGLGSLDVVYGSKVLVSKFTGTNMWYFWVPFIVNVFGCQNLVCIDESQARNCHIPFHISPTPSHNVLPTLPTFFITHIWSRCTFLWVLNRQATSFVLYVF
jgi:hypothetical protein